MPCSWKDLERVGEGGQEPGHGQGKGNYLLDTAGKTCASGGDRHLSIVQCQYKNAAGGHSVPQGALQEMRGLEIEKRERSSVKPKEGLKHKDGLMGWQYNCSGTGYQEGREAGHLLLLSSNPRSTLERGKRTPGRKKEGNQVRPWALSWLATG